ncbi:MAG: hypothetical protein ACPGJV_06660 [Bacteriovoracaceae bacterium]
MSKKKVDTSKFNKETRKKLHGFEDVVELLLEENEIGAKGDKISKEKVADTFELYEFLQAEERRLDFITELLSRKLNNLKKHSQTELLIKTQRGKLETQRQKLIDSCQGKKSKFQISMQKMYQRLF